MKKSNVYLIIEFLRKNKIDYTEFYDEFIKINGEEEKLLVNLLKLHNKYLTKSLVYSYFSLSHSIRSIENYNYSRELCDQIYNEILLNDNLNDTNYQIFYIEEVVRVLNEKIIFRAFNESEIYEPDEYLMDIIRSVGNLFKYSDSANEIHHNQDYNFILDKFNDVLDNLIYTDEYDNYSRIIRLEKFIRILTKEKVLKLDNYKFESIVEVASSIDSISKLNKFEKVIDRMIILKDNKFNKYIEKYTDNFNKNTMDLIIQNNDYKKVLKNEKKSKIYRFE